MSVPENLPYPVVFGPSFPDFTMVTKHGRQSFRSRTNQNLFLNEWDFTQDGTFTMARLLRLTSKSEECWPLIWSDVYFHEGKPIDWEFANEPQWDESEAFMRLLGFSQTEHERQFFREWCRTQYARNLDEAYSKAALTLRATGRDWNTPFAVIALTFVDFVFDFPALIPETWLNYVGPDKTPDDERHLAENPSRVDFALFAKGKKCVIEIDGPSHYADFNEVTRTYSVNEHKYAKNLAIERSLRRQGWEIYRFANSEVLAAADDDFIALVEGARIPGLWWLDDDAIPFGSWERPAVNADHVLSALERYARAATG